MVKILDKLLGYKEYDIPFLDYEDYWKSRDESREKGLKKRDKVIASLIQDGASVLDVGCGDGRMLKYLVDEKKVNGEGFDISEAALERAREKGLSVHNLDLNKEKLPLETNYDYIIMSEVIEHLPNPEKIMYNIQENFSKSLILSFPNMGHIRHRARFMLGKFPECWSWHPGEHIRFWTKKDMSYWLKREDNGFKSMDSFDFYSCVGKKPLMKLSDSLFAGDYIVEVKK